MYQKFWDKNKLQFTQILNFNSNYVKGQVYYFLTRILKYNANKSPEKLFNGTVFFNNQFNDLSYKNAMK